jgi:hypothetical protein
MESHPEFISGSKYHIQASLKVFRILFLEEMIEKESLNSL